MSYNLILNSSNVVGSNKSQYKFNFIGGAFVVNEDSMICISNLVIPYSFFNLNLGLYNNTLFQYTFAGATYSFYFKNGFYTTSDLLNYWEQVMISNNQYLTNVTTGQNYYYASLVVNTTYYANQFLFFPVPTSSAGLPSGYAAPSSGFNWNTTTDPTGTHQGTSYWSSTGATPQVVFPSTGGINSIIGFTAGKTYPSSLTTTSNNWLSDSTPNATPVNTIIVQCDLVNNPCASPSTTVDSFAVTGSFGSQIVYTPPYEKWVSITPGRYQTLSLYLTDGNYNQVQFNDSNVLISLLFKQGPHAPKKVNDVIVPKPLIRSLKFNETIDDEE